MKQVIVSEIEAEDARVSVRRELVVRFQKRSQATFAGILAEATPSVHVPDDEPDVS